MAALTPLTVHGLYSRSSGSGLTSSALDICEPAPAFVVDGCTVPLGHQTVPLNVDTGKISALVKIILNEFRNDIAQPEIV
jgi:hypothetical protein